MNAAVESPALSFILTAQNGDGGWGYRGGGSWTEPTVYALLALRPEPEHSQAFERGVAWLRHLKLPDGGWPPRPSVDQSTWVTALIPLVPIHDAQSVNWLLRQTGRETTLAYRLRQRLLGIPADGDESAKGWPWFPGSAAWVTPTSLSILALEKAARQRPSDEIRGRVESGRRFLLYHMCADGGWNHGSSHALGYDAESYPETTGQALLALRGSLSPMIQHAIAAAERHLERCRSAEGLAWLQMGLMAHGRKISNPSRFNAPCRTTMDTALSVLLEYARQGNNDLTA